MTLTERLDQLNLCRQMIRIVRADAVQFIHQFLRDTLGLGIVHAVHHPVPNCRHRSEADLLFEPIDQESRRGPVIGGLDAATFRQTLNRVVESQNRAGQANAVNLSIKPSLQRIASLIQREPDARRASVDRQDAWVSGFHVAPSFFSPNEASFAHVDV